MGRPMIMWSSLITQPRGHRDRIHATLLRLVLLANLPRHGMSWTPTGAQNSLDSRYTTNCIKGPSQSKITLELPSQLK
jgi:hypothetical protein